MPGDRAGVSPGDGGALLCNGTGDGLLSNASGDALLCNASGDALLCNASGDALLCNASGAVCTPCPCIDMPGPTGIIMSCCITWPAMAWLACSEGAPPSCTCTGAPESEDRVLLQGIVGTTWDNTQLQHYVSKLQVGTFAVSWCKLKQEATAPGKHMFVVVPAVGVICIVAFLIQLPMLLLCPA